MARVPEKVVLDTTALQGSATVIVTGDRQLLEAEIQGLEILTVAEMVERLGGPQSGP